MNDTCDRCGEPMRNPEDVGALERFVYGTRLICKTCVEFEENI